MGDWSRARGHAEGLAEALGMAVRLRSSRNNLSGLIRTLLTRVEEAYKTADETVDSEGEADGD